jgi:hypothetical protein
MTNPDDPSALVADGALRLAGVAGCRANETAETLAATTVKGCEETGAALAASLSFAMSVSRVAGVLAGARRVTTSSTGVSAHADADADACDTATLGTVFVPFSCPYSY